MASDRLTIERARPGMRVVCVDPRPPLKYMQTYTVIAAYDAEAIEVFEHPGLTFRPSRFIPADPPAPALTPGLIEALREWMRVWSVCTGPCEKTDYALHDAIERAGILDKPAPSQPFHLTPQQFQEMHNAG